MGVKCIECKETFDIEDHSNPKCLDCGGYCCEDCTYSCDECGNDNLCIDCMTSFEDVDLCKKCCLKEALKIDISKFSSEKIVEKIVEKPVEKIVEKIVYLDKEGTLVNQIHSFMNKSKFD